MGVLGLRLRVVLLSLAAFVPSTWAREMPPGALEPLTGDDGYLLVSIDSNTFLHEVRLDRQGSVLGNYQIEDVPKGRTVRVFRVPAGEYRFTRLFAVPPFWIGRVESPETISFLGKQRFDLKADHGAEPFRVEAGKLNYAGDLWIRVRGSRMNLDRPNRSAGALRLLQQRHPGDERMPLVYVRDEIDPYLSRRASLAATPGPEAGSCPPFEQLPAGEPSAYALFASNEILGLSLNPGADLVLETAYRQGQYEVNAIDPATGAVSVLHAGKAAVTDASWAGPRTAVVQLRGSLGANWSHVISLGAGALGTRQPVTRRIPVEGYVIDPLPGDPTAILYAALHPRHKDPMQVFRVDLSRQEISERQFEPRKRIDKGLHSDHAWIADTDGDIRIALVDEDDTRKLMYRTSAKDEFVAITTFDAESLFEPKALERDGSILALSNRGRGQVDLVRVDPARPGEHETVHSVPGIDLSGVVRSGHGADVVGVRYFEAGEPRVHLFDPRLNDWHRRLQAAFPDMSVQFLDVDLERGRSIVSVSNDTTPPTYYLFDIAVARTKQLGMAAPQLAGASFVARSAVDIEAPDGRSLQALLAVPAGEGPHPVLVMPHGGPFYVQDVLGFDRDVQFWATRGYAVLQVNFRGSYGFGTAHLTGGFAGFGRAIEDDIQHAVAAMLGREPRLDAGRICAVGASYGGYSALMLALRDPDTIRCAVASAAPTDLPLLFTSSDWSRDAATRRAMEKVLGEPGDEELTRFSPLYLASDLAVPVMLIHGREDRRVDYEHTERMAAALHAHGKPHRVLAIDDMSHAPETVGQKMCEMTLAEQFIREQIRRPAAED